MKTLLDFRNGLFWRTFFLLALLVMSSMATWFASFRIVENKPKAQQLAEQVVSIVTLTRAALTHAAPDNRRELLFELASNEGVRIYLLEDNDRIEPPERSPILDEFQHILKTRLGAQTRFAKKMNDVEGFWVSFAIDDDYYWLRLEQDKLQTAHSWQLAGWAAITLFLTLIGAALISKLINEPLSRLSKAARQVAKGRQPPPLPERGAREIRETNASFNRMVEDLERIESDRAVILAGISHDLRTPLARMQLEVEMGTLSDDAKSGMQSDLQQMDAIIGQFLEYARPLDQNALAPTDISTLLLHIAEEAGRLPGLKLRLAITPGLSVFGNATELRRLFGNLIENARRYGKNPDLCQIDIQCDRKRRDTSDDIFISFRDYGPGVPEEELSRILRPFTRGDPARSQANGSGLGLAIVERIVKRHGGRLRVYNHQEGGFVVVIALPPTP